MEQIEKNEERKNFIYLIAMGICFTFILMLLGYWGAAVIDCVLNEGLSIIAAFSKIIENPFGSYFNNYTPILLVLTFIFSEFLFYLLLLRQRRKEKDIEVLKNVSEEEKQNVEEEEEPEKPILDTYHLNAEEEMKKFFNDGKDESTDILEESAGEQDLFELFGVVIPKEEDNNLQEVQDEQEEISGDDVIFENLLMVQLSGVFTKEQINAMSTVRNYVPDISISLLEEMFSPDMTPEDIEEYIEIFYG